jgi:hypothetical protein
MEASDEQANDTARAAIHRMYIRRLDLDALLAGPDLE